LAAAGRRWDGRDGSATPAATTTVADTTSEFRDAAHTARPLRFTDGPATTMERWRQFDAIFFPDRTLAWRDCLSTTTDEPSPNDDGPFGCGRF